MSWPQPTFYRIRVQGRLDPSWSERMSGMTIVASGPGSPAVTTLTGELIDQSALHGVLNTLLELNLPIVSTERLAESNGANDAGADHSRTRGAVAGLPKTIDKSREK